MPNNQTPTSDSPHRQTPTRRRLADTRPSITTKVDLGNTDLYITVGFFDEPGVSPEHACDPGEIFCKVSKQGSHLQGMFSALAISASVALQHNARWESLRQHYQGIRFGEPVVWRSVEYPSIVSAFTAGIDHILTERRRMLFDDGDATGVAAPLLPPDDQPPLQEQREIPKTVDAAVERVGKSEDHAEKVSPPGEASVRNE